MSQMEIPSRLYGRNADIARLHASYKRVSSGQGEVLLIPAHSGLGKSALVQQLQGSVRNLNGYFIEGKFDQYRQNIPYFGLRQALSQLVRQLLSEDALQRPRFRADILQAVGKQGQVLVDLVPEFALLLGEQPLLGDISPQEARHRFAGVCRNFLKAICLPEHPVVLFIDDWQWADAASCELLKIIGIGSELRYLLLIASYRDDEVGAEHPLTYALDDLRNKATPLEIIELKALTAADVREIAADTLKPAIEDADGLAGIVHARTLGNPFFVRTFITFLHESNLLWFDELRDCWRWRIDKAQAGLPGSLVELFSTRLLRLDAGSRALFSLAACLGNRFELDDLCLISGYDARECKARLFSAEAKGLLLPPDAGEGGATPAAACEPVIYRFLHDRVQQAAHSLIEREQLPGTLLRIGRQLLASLPGEKLAERIFEVVSDLNAGAHLIEHTAERVKVVELNVVAARRAYAATAYRSALKFYRAASALLESSGSGEHLWRDHCELAVQLFEGRAECEFQEGDRNEAEKCIQLAVAHARTPLGRAHSLSILIVHYTLLARYPEAIAAGRRALGELGINLPEDGYSQARNDEIAMVREKLGNREVSSLSELPVMSHPEMLMASKILIAMGPPCYRSDQRLWSVIVPKVVNLTLHYGNIPQIGYSHTAFGGLLGWVDDDYATARAFGELATDLMTRKFTSASDQSVFYLMIGSSIRHWFEHLSASSRDYADAYETGLRSGNLQYAAYAFGHNMYCRFYQGVPLTSLIQESQRSLAFSRTRLNQWAIDLMEGGLNIFGVLSGESQPSAAHDPWSEQGYLQKVELHHNIQVTCIYRILETFSLLVRGENERALALSDEAEPLIYTVGTQGLLPWPEHVFARMLIFTALYAKADEARKIRWRRELDQMMNRLRIWAENCPQNFDHKHLLAAAELARIDGRHVEAMGLFDAAIEGARAGNFLQWQGIANERACSFWMEQGKERLAQVYWQEAYVCYDRWGAGAKLRSMETAYRAYLERAIPVGAEPRAGEPGRKKPHETGHSFAQRQLTQLRAHVFQLQQSSLQVLAAAQARELAEAMERVREEIAERKQAEDALQRLNSDLRVLGEVNRIAAAVIENSAEGVMVMNAALKIESVNPAFERITGYPAATTVGQTPRMLFSGKHDDAFFHQLRDQVDSQGHWQGEIWNRRRGGEMYPQETSISVLRDADGKIAHYASLFSDNTLRNEMEAKLRELSAVDGLTGIANRRCFDEVLAREWARAQREGQPLSLLMADIDYFKRYNDRNGHPGGDQCLRQVAKTIAGAVNRSSDLAARYGGEEFAVILPNVDAAGAALVAERIRAGVAALALPHGASDIAAFVTISIGVAMLIPLGTLQASNLIAAADRALYQAKLAGRNRVVSATRAEPADVTAHA